MDRRMKLLRWRRFSGAWRWTGRGRRFQIPAVEAFRGHGGVALRHEGFALVEGQEREGQERHFELHGEDMVEELSGACEYLGFVASDGIRKSGRVADNDWR